MPSAQRQVTAKCLFRGAPTRIQSAPASSAPLRALSQAPATAWVSPVASGRVSPNPEVHGSLEDLNLVLRAGPWPPPHPHPGPHVQFLSAAPSRRPCLTGAACTRTGSAQGLASSVPRGPAAGSPSDCGHLLAVLPRSPDPQQPARHSRSPTVRPPGTSPSFTPVCSPGWRPQEMRVLLLCAIPRASNGVLPVRELRTR